MQFTIDDQLRFEEEHMIQRGIDAYRKTIAQAKEGNKESRTLYGVTLMKHAVGSVEEGLKEFLEESFSGKAGRMHQAAESLALLEPDVSSFLALKVMIDGVTNELSLTNVAMIIGRAIEDEVKFKIASDIEPKWFNNERNKVNRKTGNRHYRRYNLLRKMSLKEIDTKIFWTAAERCHVGMKMIDIVIQTTGLFKTRTQTLARNKTQLMLAATPQTLEWIEKLNTRGEMMNPQYLPCVVPPRDWVSPTEGGYYSERMTLLPMVKTHNRNLLEEIPTYEECLRLMENQYAA